MVILNNMKTILKNYNLYIYILLFVFFIVSIISIKTSSYILGNSYNNLYIKEVLFYIFSFLLLIILNRNKRNVLIRYSNLIYYMSVFLLIIVLIVGKEINNSRGWISLFGLSFEPSELMKLALILKLSNIFKTYEGSSDIRKVFVSFIYTIIPFILVIIGFNVSSS